MSGKSVIAVSLCVIFCFLSGNERISDSSSPENIAVFSDVML
jgi:hypothetical protein